MTEEVVIFVDDDETLDFLEHHGVKGMHWGIRKEPSRSVGPPQKHKKAKLAAGVAAGVLTILGGAYVAKTLSTNRRIRMSEVKARHARVRAAGAVLTNRLAAQRASFKSTESKMGVTNALADAQLREWYNKFGVAPKFRTYSSAAA